MLQKSGLGQNMKKEEWVSSKGKSFTEYLVQYVREGSGGRALQ